jgi:molybdate transport system ATP-binding protein
VEIKVAVTKNFGAFRVTADFTVSGNRVGIYGPSGSGKSSLVNMLAGVLVPDEGFISLDGDCLYASDLRICAPPEQRRIAVVFQRPHLFPHMSVRGNLLYGYKRCPAKERRVELDPLVAVLKLDGLLDRGVNNLSGGEQQRVAIGRALLSNPRLLLLDEPLSALDERLKHQVIPYLKAACDTFDIPFMFISHSLLEMRLMTEQLLLFEQGRMVEQTTAEELARHRMDESQVGYINLLRLGNPRRSGGLNIYTWGVNERALTAGGGAEQSLFELSSRDIILCKKHPEAISARNLLHCRVAGTFAAGAKTGVDLQCGNERLVAEVVTQAAEELGICKGGELYAAIKASAFRKMG